MRFMRPLCENCRAWKQWSPNNDEYGTCVRHAPTPIPATLFGEPPNKDYYDCRSMFPNTLNDDWCCEHLPIKPKKQSKP